MNILNVLEVLKKANLFVKDNAVSASKELKKVTIDSRKVESGDVFIAYKGVHDDGHRFAPDAAQKGAALIILEDLKMAEKLSDTHCIVVTDAREAWAYIEAERHGNPHEKVQFIGVTGTNGKTSTVWMIRQMLDMLGKTCMSIGTLGIQVEDRTFETSHTTPDPDILFTHISEAVRSNVKYIAMEVSSHSLEQKKLGPIKFHAASFTSFSQDHLDYHGTMEQYFAAKNLLFTEYLASRGSIVCIHESVYPSMKEMEKFPRLCIYGENAAQFSGVAKISRYVPGDINSLGSALSVQLPNYSQNYEVAFFGSVFLANFVGALTLVSELIGVSPSPEIIAKVRPVPGRLEPVSVVKEQPGVFVDYAHTPDALEKVLLVAKGFCRGNLWVVFGCGGDRDRKKRPLMAAIAEKFAAKVVVTSDNPRTENPTSIIAEIMTGIKNLEHVVVIENREDAISYAIKKARLEDIVVIAGKGHEDYQIIGREKIHFDDREVAAYHLSHKV